MKDNSNWNLKFNRSSKDIYGRNLNSDDFKNVEPPFTGDTEEQFYEYISDVLNSWDGEEFLENNKEHFSEEMSNKLYDTFIEYPTEEMFDSRNKSEDIVIDGGKIDDNYRRYAGFNPIYTPKYE